jgi:hypothetical protein
VADRRAAETMTLLSLDCNQERPVQQHNNSLPFNYRELLLSLKLSMKRRRPKSLLVVVAAAGVPSAGAIS